MQEQRSGRIGTVSTKRIETAEERNAKRIARKGDPTEKRLEVKKKHIEEATESVKQKKDKYYVVHITKGVLNLFDEGSYEKMVLATSLPKRHFKGEFVEMIHLTKELKAKLKL
jgi:ABC-type Fe3+-citrate transport system substrate-binding protein